MSALEICLAIALLLTWGLMFRLYRKHLILRHLSIRSSDWCARKIEEVASGAAEQISRIAIANAAKRGEQLSEDQARQFVSYPILEAVKEWKEQVDAMQARLIRNGIRPLDYADLDGPIWSPRITGIKP